MLLKYSVFVSREESLMMRKTAGGDGQKSSSPVVLRALLKYLETQT